MLQRSVRRRQATDVAVLTHFLKAKFHHVMNLFCLDLTGTQVAVINVLNINMAELFAGAKRVEGKRGRSTNGKTIVVGIFMRQGTVLYGNRF